MALNCPLDSLPGGDAGCRAVIAPVGVEFAGEQLDFKVIEAAGGYLTVGFLATCTAICLPVMANSASAEISPSMSAT